MGKSTKIPKDVANILRECSALTKVDRDYHLSGDCEEFFICGITGRACIVREISDPDDQSSQFFSRAKCSFDPDEAANCPAYGIDKETQKILLKARADAEHKERLAAIE